MMYVAMHTIGSGKCSVWDNPEEANVAVRVYQIQYLKNVFPTAEWWPKQVTELADAVRTLRPEEEWSFAYYMSPNAMQWALEFLNVYHYFRVMEATDNEL